jgi:hypothetical protein
MQIFTGMKILTFLLILTVYSWQVRMLADDEIGKSYQQMARRYRFKVESQVEFPPGVRGKVIPVKDQEAELNRFFSALNDLGVKFVRKSGLERVVICRDLTHNGFKCAGVTVGDCIYLNYGFKKRIVYHEIFHVFDEKQHDPAWSRLNHRDFRYMEISHPKEPLSQARTKALRDRYKKIKRNLEVDFVSYYAMSKEREDRAETFACMIEEGPAFLLRAKKSTVLYNKMLYIIDMTGSKSLLGREYWQLRLGRNYAPQMPNRKKR